ncbi:hypothetical protein, partial [Legionella jordanis]|uniref:hypothetical protein n=1 Tax=Legionella jordanis TaxID=456 RepID=UPI001C812160
ACFNIDRIWLSLNFDFFMQNLLAHTLRENSTFGINYFVGGLPKLQAHLMPIVRIRSLNQGMKMLLLSRW